ncbi:MAG: hypothetical protein CUN55_07425 [Phototrophicales bacterium]|nr:MAG: hypothetical protein CUN55_07425 [Phototrophicales bacterium]
MSDRELYKTPWIRLLANEKGDAFVEMGDGVLVAAITPKREILMLREYAVAYNRIFLVLPGGAVHANESPVVSANRELQEEIGYSAYQILRLGEVYPHVKYLRWKYHVFLARDLVPSRLQGDEDWAMELVRVPIQHIMPMIVSGHIQDSTTIAALVLALRALHTLGA